MTANAVARHYGLLTPEERFALILAAGARGDDAERDRLVGAGGRITVSMSDHAPVAHAFDELALLVFIELLETAADYLDALQRSDDAEDWGEVEGADGVEGDDAEDAEAEPAAVGDEARVGGDRREKPTGRRFLDLALATGYVLRAKTDGWKRFCGRMTVPAFVRWEGLPGFDRLRLALTLSEEAAFGPAGMVRWLNAVRPAGEAELTAVPLTAEGMADAAEKLFRRGVAWWGG